MPRRNYNTVRIWPEPSVVSITICEISLSLMIKKLAYLLQKQVFPGLTLPNFQNMASSASLCCNFRGAYCISNGLRLEE